MQQIPGVQSAGIGLSLPFERALNNVFDMQSGPQAGNRVLTGELYATPGYFTALQIAKTDPAATLRDE